MPIFPEESCDHYWSLLEGDRVISDPLLLTLLLQTLVHRGRNRFMGRKCVFAFGRFCFCLKQGLTV